MWVVGISKVFGGSCLRLPASFILAPRLAFSLLCSPSDINSSPANDWAVSLRLHVVVHVRVHFLLVTSVGMIGARRHISTFSKAIVSFLFFIQAVIQVVLPPFSFVHLSAKEDVVWSGRVARWGTMKVMRMVVVGLFRWHSCGIAAFSIGVHGPVVVCAGSILTAVARANKEQAGFVSIVPIAPPTGSCYGLPIVGVPTPLLPSAAGQENCNKRHDQQ